MSKDLMIDQDTGDLVMENGSPVFVEGLDEVAQAIALILTTPQGSFLDTDYGLDMSFLTGGFDQKMAIANVEEAIKQDERVQDVPSVEVEPDYDAGVVTITAQIVTTMGNINMEQEVNTDALN
jgi:phage baseplate assembly protein W